MTDQSVQSNIHSHGRSNSWLNSVLTKGVQVSPWILGLGLLCQAPAALAEIDPNKSFSPATLYPTQISTLTIVLQNNDLTATSNVVFTDVFPDNMKVAPTPNLTNTCGGTPSASNGATAGQVSLTGGTIPAGNGSSPGRCEVTVDVLTEQEGSYVNTIDVGSITGTNNGNPDSNTQATDATLVSILDSITGSFEHSRGTATEGIVQGYETGTATITLNNTNPLALTGLAVTNDLFTSAYHITAIDGTAATTCGGTVSITAQPAATGDFGPTSTIQLTGGSIAAGDSCTITYDYTPSRDPQALSVAFGRDNEVAQNSIVTDQGATNPEAIGQRITSRTGIDFYKYFRNGTSSVETHEINLNQTDEAEFYLWVLNYNTQPITNAALTDVLPTVPGGTMEAISIDGNTCGGSVSTGTTVALTGGTIPAANVVGSSTARFSSCTIDVTVQVDAGGTYENNIPSGDITGFQHRGDTAFLEVSDELVSIEKEFTNIGVLQGDVSPLVLTFSNLATTFDITNFDLTDNLADMCASGNCPSDGYPTYFRVADYPPATTTCPEGTLNAAAGSSIIELLDFTIPSGATCQVSVPVLTSGQTYRDGSFPDIFTTSDAFGLLYRGGRFTNSIPIGNITFDTPTATGQVFAGIPRADLTVSQAVRYTKDWTPVTVGGEGGISRLRILVYHHSEDLNTLNNLQITDNLPAGHVIANPPNIDNQCGGTVTSGAGASTIQLIGGSITHSGVAESCELFIDVQAPALPNGTLQEVGTNTLSGGTSLVPGDIQGLVGGLPATDSFALSYPYNDVSADLTRQQTSVSINKEFLPTLVSGGEASRVRIRVDNNDLTALNLTDVSLTDSFTSTDMRLYATVDPTFTDLSGNFNSNGCRGGSFTGNPGDTAITLTNAEIDVAASCYFEFNVTAYTGGNHINTIAAGDLQSREGVTNDLPASATLTVDQQINVGKGFTPATIGVGETALLTLYIYNPSSTTETGASPAMVDTLPAGMEVVGTPSTTCAGGSATTGISGGQHFVQLDGGTLPATDACTVTATVQASAEGVLTNTILAGDFVTQSGTQSTIDATADLTVIAPPTISKSFSPTSIAPETGVSTLTFTLTNPNDATLLPTGLTGVSFTDPLTNMEIGSPSGVTSDCDNFSSSAVPGSNAFEVLSTNLLPSESCTVSVNISSSTPGTHPNQTSGATSDQNSTPGNPSNTATLTVYSPPLFSKTFSPSSTEVGEVSTLTFTLENQNNTTAFFSNSEIFTDFFPAGLQVADTPNVTVNGCGSQTNVRDPGNTSVDVGAGATGIYVQRFNSFISANSTCTITVDVVATQAGTYDNVTNELYTSIGYAPPATDTLVTNPVANYQDLLLVKRLTGQNSTAITQYVDDSSTADDNHPSWPASTNGTVSDYLVGLTNLDAAETGDELEYTIYFLASGAADIENVNLCDLIPANTTYVPESGQIAIGNSSPVVWNDARNGDAGEYIAPNTTVADATLPGVGLCRADNNTSQDFPSTENTNGAVWVQVDTLSSPLTPGDYGFIRFRVTVD